MVAQVELLACLNDISKHDQAVKIKPPFIRDYCLCMTLRPCQHCNVNKTGKCLAKGTHKLYEVKPRYNKRAFEAYDTYAFSKVTSLVPEPTETINYGVDISTLLAFIETGKI